MNHFKKQQIQNIADFNPREQLAKGVLAKSVPMAMLKEFQRQIMGYEIKAFNGGAKFRNGDTLLAKITPCLENGKTAFVDILDDGDVAFGSTEFIVLRAKNETNPEFLYYFSISPDFRKRAIECMEGTSGRQRVNENTLKTLELPIPEPQTQQSIAAVLSALDKKIALNKQINARLEEMAKTLYDYWFVQFDFPDANGRPYKSSGGEMVFDETLKREIPKGWEVKSLGEVITHSTTGLNPRDNFSLGNGENFYVTIKNIKDNEIKFHTCAKITDEALNVINKRSKLDKGDILFTSIEPIGSTYLLHEKPKNWDINESVFSIRSKSDFITPYFLFMLLSSDEIKSFTRQVSTGSVHKGIRHESLKRFTFAYSGIDLIKNFTNLISPMQQNIFFLQKQNHHLTQLRDFLLPMLMNGQVSVAE
jgi:hypothetical protein